MNMSSDFPTKKKNIFSFVSLRIHIVGTKTGYVKRLPEAGWHVERINLKF